MSCGRKFFGWILLVDSGWVKRMAIAKEPGIAGAKDFDCRSFGWRLYETADKAGLMAIQGAIVVPVDLDVFDASPGKLFGVAKEGLSFRRKTHDDRGAPLRTVEPGPGTYCGSGDYLFSSLEVCRYFYRRKLMDSVTKVFSIDSAIAAQGGCDGVGRSV